MLFSKNDNILKIKPGEFFLLIKSICFVICGAMAQNIKLKTLLISLLIKYLAKKILNV